MAEPRVTFGILVLNGEPFTRYTLRSLYPFAHEIIVVEGATPAAANIATADGHSRDGTLDVLQRFKAQEDPDDKLQLVIRDGFWSEKDEMSQAYARRATGNYLWQVDIDEFYRPEDMRHILAMLAADPTITAMSFKQLTFWGAPDIVVDSWFLQRGADVYHRLFKWAPGYTYATHRPPTALDERGHDLRTQHWISADTLAGQGIYLYHYSLLFPKQVIEKCDYYAHVDWTERSQALDWAENAYLHLKQPFRVHNVYETPGWLERYSGPHPAQIEALWADIRRGDVTVETRAMDDVDRLLSRWWYRLGRAILKRTQRIDQLLRSVWHLLGAPVRLVNRLRRAAAE
ncbi:MAG: glycosyltransferase family 2 protein [Chloroflexi bacterium]|nr:glycosyltransferase family 2 protein [Chloroflexota bacterium]